MVEDDKSSEKPSEQELSQQKGKAEQATTSAPSVGIPPSGALPALQNISRSLSEEDLKEKGVQKILLQLLDMWSSELDTCRPYKDRFHSTDKESAVLKEKLSATKSVDKFATINLTLGGAIVGLSPSMWDMTGKLFVGVITLLVGTFLILSGLLVRRRNNED